MNRKLMLSTLVLAALPLTTLANESDCFPMCADVVQQAEPEAARPACANSTLREANAQVDAVNEQIKPVKEIVGYVRSPQGLAVKLINDHVFKIPAWVGYALDPVGSLKQRAVSEVRGHAKELIGLGKACTAPEAAPQGTEVVEPFEHYESV